MTLKSDVQGTATDPLVTLYEIDLTPLGVDMVFRYTNRPLEDGGNVVFNGENYILFPIEASGFERQTKTLPTPHLKCSNIDGTFSTINKTYGEIVGAIFTRIRTFRKYLDDGSDPDPTSMFPADIFIINQKVMQDNEWIEWECRAATELPGFQLPARQALRDRCTQIYRFFDVTTGLFDYSIATCPYTGATYYDKNDTLQTNPALDSCSKLLSGCHKRFDPNPLPTWQFPGLGQTQ